MLISDISLSILMVIWIPDISTMRGGPLPVTSQWKTSLMMEQLLSAAGISHNLTIKRIQQLFIFEELII